MSYKNKTPNEMLFAQASPDKVMPVVMIWRGIWKWVFDEMRCSLDHRKILEEEILKWNDIVTFQKRLRLTKYGTSESDSNPVGQKGNIIDELEHQVGLMSKVLVDNEQGLWDYHKDTLRLHNIDYRKSIHCKFWFPEIPTDYAKGQAALKKAQEDNPQDYLPNPT